MQITHLIVGGPDYNPTQKELDAIVEEFLKPMPVFMRAVSVKTLFVDPRRERLMLTVGAPDWAPTGEEIEDLRAKFHAAKFVPEDSIVATRSGVHAKVIGLPLADPDAEVK